MTAMARSRKDVASDAQVGESVRVRVDSTGRLVVPARFRAALGIRAGGRVLLTLEDDGLTMTTREAALDAAVARAQGLSRKYGNEGGGEVDAFLAERRAEAAHE